MNCAICDDDKTVVEAVKTIVENVLHENGCVGNISAYTDSRLFFQT